VGKRITQISRRESQVRWRNPFTIGAAPGAGEVDPQFPMFVAREPAR